VLQPQRALAQLLEGWATNPMRRLACLQCQFSKTIGLIVPDLADSFFSICAHAVQQLAANQGYLTLLSVSERDGDNEARELAIMNSLNIAGIPIVPSGPDSIGQLKGLHRVLGMSHLA
jgi:DNA-binding LacI/PurR family transcriptional regulator